MKKSKIAEITEAREKRRKKNIRPQGKRLAWTGLTEQEFDVDGGILLAWLVQEANDRGLQMNELASALNITYGYFSHLRNQGRLIRHISNEFAQRCADFLGISLVSVYMAAGRIRPEDVYENPAGLGEEVVQALAVIRKDKAWKYLFPENFSKVGFRAKLAVVFAYEEATGETLMPSRVDLQSIVEFAAPLNLMDWLYDASEPMSKAELAKRLGFGYGYLAQLTSGLRKTENISDEFADAVANFLEVPRLAVLIAARRVNPEDFAETEESLESQLERAMRFILKDPMWGHRFPQDAYRADARTKQLYVAAYERATGRLLIPIKME